MLLHDMAPAVADLEAAVNGHVRVDYVYAYPPRQAYRPLDPDRLAVAMQRSLARYDVLNLYVHVPFCKQICSYCNLFATAGAQGDDQIRYADMVLAELDHYLPLIAHRDLDTLYLGGGTPSLFRPELLARLTGHVRQHLCADFAGMEVALEVAPDTVSEETLAGFRGAGINRINLGVQTWDSNELNGIGRRHDTDVHERALRLALAAGFDNVCVDLIYGLPGQTADTWRSSLETVLSYRPPTICCYALTLRPNTGYAQRGIPTPNPAQQYDRYDTADAMLAEAGYKQETNVRWVLPGRGGYRQKANHWMGQDILGVGAGARSYLRYVDFRNGYSVRRRKSALMEYEARIRQKGHGRTDGFLMTRDERARKAVILGLGNLGRDRFRYEFGADPTELFRSEFRALLDVDLVSIDQSTISLTRRGQRHRDVVVQLFFSKEVRALVTDHDYNE